MLRGTPGFILAFVVLLAPAASLAAQGGRSEIHGTIQDAVQAVLPGVTVTAINKDTGQERTATTSGDGRYVIPTLPPGTYSVKAQLDGFQTATREDLVVNVGQEVALNLTLQL